jgi:hypothetical protein
MKHRKWVIAGVLLLTSPSLLPFSLEVIALVELFGLVGLWTIYSTYVTYWINHPVVKRIQNLVTTLDAQPQMCFSISAIKKHPQLLAHMFPIKGLLLAAMGFFWCNAVWVNLL